MIIKHTTTISAADFDLQLKELVGENLHSARYTITRKILNDKYDELYELADQLVKKLNPCHIKPIFNGETNKPTGCMSCNGKATGTPHLCCRGNGAQGIPVCKHLGKRGCRVKSLKCKLWFCARLESSQKVEGWETIIMRLQNIYGENVEGSSVVPIFNVTHARLIYQMKAFQFHLVSREGKGKSIEAAYRYFKNIKFTKKGK